MKNFWKRAISFVLAVLMLCGSAPQIVSAMLLEKTEHIHEEIIGEEPEEIPDSVSEETELPDFSVVPLSSGIKLQAGILNFNTLEIEDNEIYASVVGYELKKGHTLSISNSDYVFSVRIFENGNYNTMLKQATAENFVATKDMTVGMLIRKPDKSALTEEEVASVRIIDSQYGMIDVPGFAHRFTVEAETIEGGTATTRAAIFLPESYSENGETTKLVLMTNGARGHLSDSMWNNGTADDIALMKNYMEAGYAVLVVDNTAGKVGGTQDWGNPQHVDSYFKAYEYVQNKFNLEEQFYIHSRSMGTFAAVRIMREHPELVKCAIMCGATASLRSRFGQNPKYIAKMYGFDDLSGETYEADKVIGYDPYVDVVGAVEYALPPTFWMLSEADANSAVLSMITNIESHGNDVRQKVYTGTDHSGVCRLNIEECWNDAIAYFEEYEKSKTEHRFCAWQILKEATCSENGEMERKCADCDYSENIEIEKLGKHIFESGFDFCSACGEKRLVELYVNIPVEKNKLQIDGTVITDTVYGHIKGYELLQGRTLSISSAEHVFSVRQLIDGNYSTELKVPATAESYTARKDMTIGILVRRPDSGELSEGELDSICIIDSIYGMTDVPGYVHRFTVEAETIEGGTATTRAAIFLPESYSETGTPTKLIVITNGYSAHLTDSVWYKNSAENVQVIQNYLNADYAVWVVDNTAASTSQTPDLGCPQLVDSYFKAYEYIQNNLNVEKKFSVHSRSFGTFAAIRIMREHPELVKCAVMTGPRVSFKWAWDRVQRSHVANRFGFDDMTGATYEADKLVGYDPYTDVKGEDYDLPPTFWMMAFGDYTAEPVEFIQALAVHGNDAISKTYSGISHTDLCALNTSETFADALAYLEKHQVEVHTHSYSAVATAPTCTEKGYTTYTCECGDSYVDGYVAATGHKRTNGICSVCGDSFAGKKVSILSASTSTYAGVSNDTNANSTIGKNAVYYTEGRHGVYRKDTWWQQTIDALGMELLVNNSWSGSCIFQPHMGADSVGYGRRAVNLHNDHTGEEPDIILVQLGGNDFAYYKDTFGKATDIDYTALIKDNGDGTFTYAEPNTTCEAFAIMLHKVHNRYQKAEIYYLTCYAKRDPDYSGDSYPDTGQPTEYNAEFIKVVQYFDLAVIDLEHCIPKEAERFDLYMADKRAHPNSLGMDRITNKVLSVMLGKESEICHVTSEDGTVKEQAVILGRSYSAEIELPEGYTVSVTMDGRNITSEVFKDGKITIPNVTGDISVTADRRPMFFRWEIEDGHLVSTGKDENALTVLSETITDGIIEEGQYQLEIPLILKHDKPWTIEWKCAGNWRAGVFSPYSKTPVEGESTFYLTRTVGGQLCFGTRAGSQYDNYGVDISYLDEQMHMFRLENRIAEDGSNMVWLCVDGTEIGPMNNYYLGSNSQSVTSDWVSGKDFKFSYMGTESNKYRNCELDYIAVWENGEKTEPLSLRYDDRYDVSGKNVEIVDAGKPASYKVGYGVAEGTPDDAVVTLVEDKIIATGIGTAKVRIDGVLYEITVEAASISLLLLIGQSNMRGSEGNADQSIVCPDGMVYSTFGDDRGDAEGIMNVNNATKFAASALAGEYSSINVEGTTEHLSYYPIHSLTEEGKGKIGPDSGFAYEWVEQTGEKVWVVNAAHGGSSIKTWQPDATNYKEAVLLFGACQETLRKEIAAGHYTLSHMAYFWCQGCSDAAQTAEWYVNKYLAMHNGFMNELAFDHDSDSSTPDYEFEFGGIIPVRAGNESSACYRQGVYTDTTTAKYYESFKDLRFTGPRVAQYWLGNNPDCENIHVVCNIGEDWVWMPDGTNGVSDYFNAHYENGRVDYQTQVAQKESWYIPTTPAAVHDTIHYNQIGYNEWGRESVRNALVLLGEIKAPETETTVELLSWDGYTEVSEISASTSGNSATLVVPKVYPLWKAKEAVCELSEGLEYVYYDIIAENEQTNGALTVSIDESTVLIKGHIWSDWETIIEPSAERPGEEKRICSECGKEETREVKGVWQIYDLSAHLAEMPENICPELNLWNILEHDEYYFANGNGWGKYGSRDVYSVTIPVKEEDKIYATSFGEKGENGHETSNGIRVTFFDSYGIAKTMNPDQCYSEFSANGGYLVAPEGAIAVNIPMWNNSDENEIYILNLEHEYKSAIIAPNCREDGYTVHTCAACGDSYVDSIVGTTGEHSYSAVVTEPTCVDKGYTTYTCTGCGISYFDNYTDPTGEHIFSEWEEIKIPTEEGCGEEKRSCIVCELEEIREIEGVWQIYNLSAHLLDLPEYVCCDTNLWTILPHEDVHFTSGKKWGKTGTPVTSITIPVNEGERLYATSWNKAGENGHETSDGIRLTFFDAYGIALTLGPGESYRKFAANGGYLEAPEGAVAINIAMWYDSEDYEVYILNREHTCGEVVVEPTCIEEGYSGYLCLACGEGEKTIIPSLGHTEVIDKAVAPTCTETGLTEGKHCSVCGEILVKQNVVPALGHNYESVVTEPTCTEQGYTTHTCSVCGDSCVDSYVEAKGHSFGEWNEITAPTCDNAGQDKQVCSVCSGENYRKTYISGDSGKILVENPLPADYFEGKKIVTLGDSVTFGAFLDSRTTEAYPYVLGGLLGATISNKGVSGSSICTGGHVAVNESLTENNIKGADVVTIMLGINDFNHAVKDGIWQGKQKYEKGSYYYDLGDYNSTDTSEYYGALRAWCEQIAEFKKMDKFKDTQFIFITMPQSAMNRSVSSSNDWNQDKENIYGRTLREYCTAVMEICAEYDIPVFDANMFSGIYYNSPEDNNVDLTGGDGVHPSAAGHVLIAESLAEFLLGGYSYEERAVENCGHSFSTEVTEPTCTEGGFTTYRCPECYYKFDADYTEAIGHTEVIDEAVAPTCTETGLTEGKHCSVCGEILVKQNVVPALGHTEVIDEAVAPTCTETGLTEGKHCSVCGEVLVKQNVVPALGHTEVIDKAVAPTCTETGLTEGKHCSVCDEVLVAQEIVAALGHTFGEWEITKEPKYPDDGEESRICLKCDVVEFRSVPITAITSGNFGYGTPATDKIIYTIYSDGTMTVEGEGKTFYCNWDAEKQPFKGYRDLIKNLIIGEGITVIERGSFAYFSNLETVSFPSTLTAIQGNAFMASFVKEVNSITVPKSVNTIGVAAFGASSGNTFFTDIVIENPDINFPDKSNSFYHSVFNYGRKPEKVTLYSYGTENNVSAYAKDIGYNYVDLNNYEIGEFSGVKYEYYNGILTLSTDSEGVLVPSENAPWHEHRNEVTKIVIGEGITGISENAFVNYPALGEVALPDSFKIIGNGAFAVAEGEFTPLEIRIPKRIEKLGKDIFAGRNEVELIVYYGSIAENFAEPGVNLVLRKQFKMLMVGNSLTNDAANRHQGMIKSQLHDALQAMLGKDAEITIGVIFNGGRSVSWYATQTELGTKHTLGIISSDNNIWRSAGSFTMEEALSWTDWDAVSLQPYSLNIASGAENVYYPEEVDEKYIPLNAASEYMLDCIGKYSPYADVFCYMHWSMTKDRNINAGLSTYKKFEEFYPSVLDYAGTKTGKRFKTIIPVGLSVQNARTTYFALLNYNANNEIDLVNDPQIGLQRDGVHLSFNIGRYIAGLTFAEMVIPEEMREEGYVLPDIRITESVGKLPAEYTEIAQKSVFAAVESWKNGSLAVTEIEGYKVDPVDTESAKLAEMKIKIPYAADEESLKDRIKEAVIESLPEDFNMESVVLAEDFEIIGEGQEFEAEIEIRFGYMSKKINVSFAIEKALYGDINLDGKVDVMDAYYIRLVVAKLRKPTEQQILLGDVDLDGKITAIDANIIRKFAIKMIETLPVQ